MSDWQNAETRRFALVHRPLRPLRFQLHPFVAAGLGLLMLALLGWSGATTTYALFRDEFLIQIVSRHTASERASSAEIARLKTDLDRVNSRLLVEREGFVEKLDALSRRQADVERRQDALSSFAAPDASADPAVDLRLRPDEPLRQSSLPSGDHVSTASLSERYNAIERRQRAALTGVELKAERERKDLAGVYAALGLTPLPAPVEAGLGGIYIPVLGGRADPAIADLDRIEDSAAEITRLRGGLDRLPVRSPYPGAHTVSGFGNRTDPFLGTVAFHSGVDLDVPAGAPARATAAGTVVSAGWSGGYGLMVEIRHDLGFSTRYGHLSKITVVEGQPIKTGDVVGLAGSTGRSTGPHLHYETRRNDAALDPRRFLAAGAVLAN